MAGGGKWPLGPLRLALLAATLVIGVAAPPGARSEPNNTGQTGLINMPDARLEPDGTLRMGFSHIDSRSTLWGSITALPRLELTVRKTVFGDGEPGFDDDLDADMDDGVDVKLMILRESEMLPQFAIGRRDFSGDHHSAATFLTLSKRYGDFDFTAGYGDGGIGGFFAGLRYSPNWHPRLGLVVEYEADDDDDFDIGSVNLKGDAAVGIEYHYRWLGTRLSYSDGDVGLSAFLALPLSKREFVRKTHEPAPYTQATPRASLDEWRERPQYRERLIDALRRQGYEAFAVALDGDVLRGAVTHPGISLIGRAIGRAARTMLLLGPLGISEIEITYVLNDQPILTYRFTAPHKLERYLDGLISRSHLEQSIEIAYASPDYHEPVPGANVEDLGLDDLPGTMPPYDPPEGPVFRWRSLDALTTGLYLSPLNVDTFINDAGAGFHHELFSLAHYRYRLAHGLFLDTAGRVILSEDVSDLEQPSVSRLPHVRSDIAAYKGDGRFRLDTLLLNKYLHPAERVYARVSAGFYEEMFAAVGGQVLYLPQRGDWALDLSVDYVRQRDTGGGFEFRSYSAVTALASLHYRLPWLGLTATARVGQFLAKDFGTRFELSRRFRSGVEFGAWYTITDGDDITAPGSPGSPYFDRGVYLSLPLSAFLTRDTRAHANFAFKPWVRDVGQMVKSPGDLYRLLSRLLALDRSEQDWLTDFGQ